ncbi:MAG: hypothetical protein GYA23_08975 [Methanomicrobiales archaeon]|nr:hypothetical protein [Methanomicrobiales archaeon]
MQDTEPQFLHGGMKYPQISGQDLIFLYKSDPAFFEKNTSRLIFANRIMIDPDPVFDRDPDRG